MAARRPVNPRLLEAFQREAVEPFDMDAPGRVVEVPVPAEHFQPPTPASEPAPPSRYEVVRDYLARTRQDAAPPNLPEVDMAEAQREDAMATLAAGGRNAAAAFLGNRAAGFANPNVTRNVDAAKAAQAQRSKALADWAETQRRGRLDEAEVLGRSLAEPGKKDPENEKAKREIERDRLEWQKQKDEGELDLKRDRLEWDKTRPRGKGKGAGGPGSADEVRFDDMTFRFVGAPDTPKAVKELGAKELRRASARWGIATEALKDLQSTMEAFRKSPSPSTRAALRRPALAAAAAVNAAIGQGAMSDAEKNAQFEALGINLSDVATIEGLLSSNPEELVSRIMGAKALARRSMTAEARAYGYDPAAAKAEGPRADGLVDIEDPDNPGSIISVSPKLAEKLKKKGAPK